MTTARSGKEVRQGNRGGEPLVIVGGIVVPIEWDQDGNPTALAISTKKEEVYRIKPDTKVRELLGFLRQEIEAEGMVSEGAGLQGTVTVKRYWLK